MELRSEVQLASVIKALRDVVLPAIDASNRLALEQGQLVLGMLKLMERQIPLQFRFDCDELRRWVRLCADLEPLSDADPNPMQAFRRRAEDVLARAKADPAEVLFEIRNLRSAVSAQVTKAYAESCAETRQRTRKLIMAAAAEQVHRDRAWACDQGWEPDPAAIAAIEDLI